MAEIIHARTTPDGLRFRVWLTIPDRYGTDALTREEMTTYLFVERYGDPHANRFVTMALAEIGERLDRAAATSTSELGREPDAGKLAEPWDTERCRTCEGFHHAFDPSAVASRCAQCGEPKRCRYHAPPCAPKAP